MPDYESGHEPENEPQPFAKHDPALTDLPLPDWIESVSEGGLVLRHSPTALRQREREVLPVMLALLAAYAVFWLMVALSPAIRQALAQVGLSPALQMQLLLFWILTGGLMGVLLRRRVKRWAQERVRIAASKISIERVTLWGQTQTQAELPQARFDFYLRHETRQLQSGLRQRWVQELRVILPEGAPFLLWAELDRFTAEALPAAVLPEEALQQLADRSQKSVSWEIAASSKTEKRRGVIAPAAFV